MNAEDNTGGDDNPVVLSQVSPAPGHKTPVGQVASTPVIKNVEKYFDLYFYVCLLLVCCPLCNQI